MHSSVRKSHASLQVKAETSLSDDFSRSSISFFHSLQPLFDIRSKLLSIIRWDSAPRSFIFLFLSLWICIHITTLPFMLILAMLWYILVQYVNLQFRMTRRGQMLWQRENLEDKLHISVLARALDRLDLNEYDENFVRDLDRRMCKYAMFLNAFFSHINWSSPKATKRVVHILCLLLIPCLISYRCVLLMGTLLVFLWKSPLEPYLSPYLFTGIGYTDKLFSRAESELVHRMSDPHTITQSVPYMSGYLLKEGGGTRVIGRTSRKKRWFVLDNGYLSYYKNKKSESPIKGLYIDISDCKLSIRDVETHCFTIQDIHPKEDKHTRTFVLYASSVEDMNKWIGAFQQFGSQPCVHT